MLARCCWNQSRASWLGLGAAGVVGIEAVDGAVVGDADEQGAALAGVQERGDGLEAGGLERLEELAGVGVGAQGGLVLEVGGLLVGAEELDDVAVLLVGDLGLALDERQVGRRGPRPACRGCRCR